MINQYKGHYIKCFHYKHRSQDFVVPHSHDDYELICYLGGSGRFSIQGEIHNYQNNTFVLIEPNAEHDEYVLDETEVYFLRFQLENIKLSTFFFTENNNNSALIKQIMEYIYMFEKYETKMFKQEHPEYYLNIVVMLLLMIQKIEEKDVSGYREQMVAYVKDYLKKNLRYKIDFNILSESIGYSSNRLRVIFKEETGKPVYQYLNDIRLGKAKDLLKNTDKSIISIGKECGFQSKIRFALFFSEKTGLSPSKYRAVVRTENKNDIYNKNEDIPDS